MSILTLVMSLSTAGARGAAQHNDLAIDPSTILHHSGEANGVTYHDVVSGSGPAVVVLHGGPTTWYDWHKIIPMLAGRYTVIAPDLRGLGLTERTDGGYDKRTVAEDIYQLVRHLGQERVYVVGHDIGGMVAFAVGVDARGDTWNAGTPARILPGGPYATYVGGGIRNYDVGRDGRFLMLRRLPSDQLPSSECILIQNWAEELKSLVPVN